MKTKLLLFAIVLSLCTATTLTCQTPPTLPNTSSINTCFPDTTGYLVITVGPSLCTYTNLQTAINAAPLGSILKLTAGATFTGSFSLPNKGVGTKWIIIMGSAMQNLPLENFRVDPTQTVQLNALPKILTTTSGGSSLPALKTLPSAHHYRLMGLEIATSTIVSSTYGIINLGDNTAVNQGSLAQVPSNIIIDRCYIHGNPYPQSTMVQRGLLLNSSNSAVINSYISEIHSSVNNVEGQAIACSNSPGPLKIINNYIEAGGEGILFGGAIPAITNLVPSDIEIRNNHFYKPIKYFPYGGSFNGDSCYVKNHLEFKTGVRILADGNVFENVWAGVKSLSSYQSGYAVLLTVRSLQGGSWAHISDVSITNNYFLHSGAGINLSGHDSQDPTDIVTQRVKIANNLFDDINGPVYGDGNLPGPNIGTFMLISLSPKNVIIDHNTVLNTGAITWATAPDTTFAITNNLFNCYVSGGGYSGIYGPGLSEGNNTLGTRFSDITDANQRFHKNVLISGNSTKYNNYATTSKNYFPANATAVSFVNYTGGAFHLNYHDYALTTSSTYHNFASDGKDIGVDLTQLDNAFANSKSCTTTLDVFTITESNSPTMVYPNPANSYFIIFINNVDKMSDVSMKMFDINGKEVIASQQLVSGKFEINTENLPTGIYFVQVKNSAGVFGTSKVVVVR